MCMTSFVRDPLCFVKVLDYCLLVDQTVHPAYKESRLGLFFRMSTHSRVRLGNANDYNTGTPVNAVIAKWVREHNNGAPFLFEDVVFSVCTPHAVMLTTDAAAKGDDAGGDDEDGSDDGDCDDDDDVEC